MVFGTTVLATVFGACGPAADNTNAQDAESWKPQNDVILTVPAGAGGGTDTMGRAIASGLEEVRPEITVAVENRPGAHVATGYTYMTQQEGDPHELVAAETTLVTMPLTTDVPFDQDSFTPIGQVSDQVGLLAVSAGKYGSLSEFLQQTRSREVLVGITGGEQAIFGLMLSSLEAAAPGQFQVVSLDTGSSAMQAVIAGDVDAAVMSPEHATSYLKEGSVQGLAVFAPDRIPFDALKKVPTAQEEGIDAAYVGLRGLMAPGNISDAEQRYWENAFLEWTETSSYDKYIENTQSLARPVGANEFEANLADLFLQSQQIIN